MNRDEPRRDVVRRYFRHGRLTFAHGAVQLTWPAGPPGRLLWVPVGTEHAGPCGSAGHRLREPTHDELDAAPWRRGFWTGNDVLMLIRPGRAHSVWWFYREGAFTGWYVNLEAPSRWWDDGPSAGVDTVDHALDVTVLPDGAWSWKDEGEFRAATQRGVWSRSQAVAIRTEGRRVLDDVRTRRFPFDGTWSDGPPHVPGPPPRLGPEGHWAGRPAAVPPGRAA